MTDKSEPIFPCPELHQHPGATLRDWFAVATVTGLVTFENGERLNKLFGSRAGDSDSSAEDYFAAVAYRIADAMLKAREAVQ